MQLALNVSSVILFMKTGEKLQLSVFMLYKWQNNMVSAMPIIYLIISFMLQVLYMVFEGLSILPYQAADGVMQRGCFSILLCTNHSMTYK